MTPEQIAQALQSGRLSADQAENEMENWLRVNAPDTPDAALAAREFVADQGYEGMVMSQVAERAGVSPTTLYNLYNTKDELVLAALRELLVENTLKIEQESIGPGWKQIVRRVHNGGLQAQSAPA